MHKNDARIRRLQLIYYNTVIGSLWSLEAFPPDCRGRTFHRPWELVPMLGVQRSEDARNLTSLRARRRSPGDLEQPPGNRRRKISEMPF
jgi:hypothetical protein